MGNVQSQTHLLSGEQHLKLTRKTISLWILWKKSQRSLCNTPIRTEIQQISNEWPLKLQRSLLISSLVSEQSVTPSFHRMIHELADSGECWSSVGKCNQCKSQLPGWKEISIRAEWNEGIRCSAWTFCCRQASASGLSVTRSRPLSYTTAGLHQRGPWFESTCSCSFGIFYWFFPCNMCYWWETGPGAGRLNLERRTRWRNWIKKWKLSFSDLSNWGQSPFSIAIHHVYGTDTPDLYQLNRASALRAYWQLCSVMSRRRSPPVQVEPFFKCIYNCDFYYVVKFFKHILWRGL